MDLDEFAERGVVNLPIVLQGIYNVMAELLKRGYMPEDVQPTNFLVDRKTLKVALKDYSSIFRLEDDPYTKRQFRRHISTYSDIFIPPERRHGIVPADHLVVCFGLLIYFLTTTRSPAWKNCDRVCRMMFHYSDRRLKPLWNSMSEIIAQLNSPIGKLIKLCLARTSDDRIGFAGIKELLQDNEKDTADESHDSFAA